ncbi:MAG: hypothetical protein JWL58_5827 [Streptosporangiaceae bacterium]|jgi:hypothetical protein|nr:hypothetical protein [Streptosporangiaceae bacterium]
MSLHRLALPLALIGALSTACSSASSSGASPDKTASIAKGPLSGICPSTVVIQTDWLATAERAAAYQLVGPNGKVDAKKGSYSGPLGSTGVNVEVRLGGPSIGFQPPSAQMYQDKSIYLAYVATDVAIQSQAKFPTTAVVAPLNIDPQIIMWDPATYTINSWTDVARTKAKVLYTEGLSYMDALVAKGLVTKDQKDSSFDGTPSRFVAEKGKVMQQGYASNEPYRWEHDVTSWKKPVKYLLVHDAGWPVYPQGLAVRSGELSKDSACLKKLVPMIQKAQADYIKDPSATNATLVKIATEIPGGPPVTAAGNANAVTVMKQLKIVANGPSGTLGTFDPARVDASIALLKPIFKAKGVTVPDGLKASDLVTNEFIDPSISLG